MKKHSSQETDELVNPPPPPLPFRFWWLWIILVIALGFSARPAFRFVKHLRAQSFDKEAEQALSQGNFVLAREKAMLSLRLVPGDIRAFRVMARMGDAKKDPQALRIWELICSGSEATAQDRLAYAEAALRENQLKEAEQQITQLLNDAPSKEVYHLAGLLAYRQQKPNAAREWFQKALGLDPHYARAIMNLARTEMSFHSDRSIQKQGIEKLIQLGDRNDEWALNSLQLLVEFGANNPTIFPFDSTLAKKLTSHSGAGVSERCLVADWEIRSAPQRADELVSQITSSTTGLSDDDKKKIGIWLNQKKLFQTTLKVFPPSPDSEQDLLLVQLDAMAALGQWQKIHEFLAQDISKMDPVLLALYRGRVSRELGNEKLFDIGWRKAIREASGNFQAMLYIADYAEKLGEFDKCAEVYENLLEAADQKLHFLLKLVRLYERTGRTRDLLRTIQRISEVHTEPAVVNDAAYLGLLLNDAPKERFESAYLVYQSDPKKPAFVTTYALAQLRTGSPELALKAYDSIEASDLAAPGWKAVYAATLGANGKKKEAVKIAEGIEVALLKPEEKQLILEYLPPSKSKTRTKTP
jgi:tetratricopeptide (TPR) repeat protein